MFLNVYIFINLFIYSRLLAYRLYNLNYTQTGIYYFGDSPRGGDDAGRFSSHLGPPQYRVHLVFRIQRRLTVVLLDGASHAQRPRVRLHARHVGSRRTSRISHLFVYAVRLYG